MTPIFAAHVDQIAALYDREVQLRQHARRLELNPLCREAAIRLFVRATGLREQRLALLARCGLN